MSPKIARRIAWSLVGLWVCLSTAGLALQWIARTPFAQSTLPALTVVLVLVGLWMILGAVIISHHPRHPVGWLLCAGLFAAAFDMFSAGYAAYDTYVYPGILPGVDLALIWLTLVSLGPHGLVAFTWILLLFPDGKFLSPAGRRIGRVSIITFLLFVPIQALEPGPADAYLLPARANPLGAGTALWAALKPLLWTGFSILVLCYLAACISLVLRLRRSRGDARQQIKWLVIPAFMYGAFILLFLYGYAAANETLIGFSIFLGQLAIAGIVIAVAFAVFKYRLYDVDLIIRRSLQYLLLTAILGLLYISGIVVFQYALAALTGERDSPLVIVLTTLFLAALFNPLRSRTQAWIDRRFYRARYDAEKALSSFARAARDEVDMNCLTDQLLRVVSDTMQPAKVLLLVRTNLARTEQKT